MEVFLPCLPLALLLLDLVDYHLIWGFLPLAVITVTLGALHLIWPKVLLLEVQVDMVVVVALVEAMVVMVALVVVVVPLTWEVLVTIVVAEATMEAMATEEAGKTGYDVIVGMVLVTFNRYHQVRGGTALGVVDLFQDMI